jgi:hypothetical protein
MTQVIHEMEISKEQYTMLSALCKPDTPSTHLEEKFYKIDTSPDGPVVRTYLRKYKPTDFPHPEYTLEVIFR